MDGMSSRIIASKFKEFISSQGYDSYEVALVCSQVLNENNIDMISSRVIGLKLFDEEEDIKEEYDDYDLMFGYEVGELQVSHKFVTDLRKF